MKKRIKAFHKKRPYIDPIVNIVFGAVLGTIISDVRFNIQSGESIYDIRTIFPIVISLSIIILYFIFFSSYAAGKYQGTDIVRTAAFEEASSLIHEREYDDLNRLCKEYQVMKETFNIIDESN